MFKRAPQTKPATPLRSSSRRHLLSHLVSLYPVLAYAPPELLAQLLPEGTKQCNAITSTGVKVIIYAEPEVGGRSGSGSGRALWFEAGSENGAWMNTGKKGGGASGSGSGGGKNGKAAAALHEVLPTIYTLWLVPNLLPVLPTWQQVIDPALLGGSALMVPGLISPPATYATSSTHPTLPPRNALVSIVAHPGNVPQVLARLEMDMHEVVRLREQGGKGKAAVVLHAYKDGLWAMGGEEGMGTLPESVQLLEPAQVDTKGDEEGEGMLSGAMAEASINDQGAATQQDTGDQRAAASGELPVSTFTTSEVDAILHLALLSAIQDAASSQDSALFPISASAFYSSHVLPHRPSHWPPRPTKGKRAKKSKTKGLPGSFGGGGGGGSGSSSVLPDPDEEERLLNADQVVVGRSSTKKFGKWLKVMEKERGLIRTKESRGETSIVEVLAGHQDVQGLTPYQTLAEWQATQGTESNGGTPATGIAGAAAAGSEASSGSSSSSSTPGTSLHVEHFYSASPSGRALFDELGLAAGSGSGSGSGSQDLHAPSAVRKSFTEYMGAHVTPLPKNQAMVLPDEALCGHLGLLPAAAATAGVAGGAGGSTVGMGMGRGAAPRSQPQPQPQPRKREELHRLFVEKCTVSWHRVSRLTQASIEHLAAGGADASGLKLAPGEHLGKLVKGAPPTPTPSTSGSNSLGSGSTSRGVITIKIRRRQGNKVVSLLSGLEAAYINPERFAGEVMRHFGTSTSVAPLVGAPAGAGWKEVLVQGDLRKGLLEKLWRENGVQRGLVASDEKAK